MKSSYCKLLKNLGALSEYAKCGQSSTKIKKFEILTLNPGYYGMVKETISRYCPYNVNCTVWYKMS
jgi:hypothetical protein